MQVTAVPTDADLYASVIDGMRAGASYYPLVVSLHRERNYPLRPFVTVRSPVLAVAASAMGDAVMTTLLLALAVTTTFAWWVVCKSSGLGLWVRFIAIGLLCVSCLLLNVPRLPLFHETWAGLLIALSLAIRRPERFLGAIAIGCLACFIRELAMAYLALMLACALIERRWREAAGWFMGILAGFAFLALHAHWLAPYLGPDETASQGWTGLGGLPFYLHTVRSATALVFLPPVLAYSLVPLCLFGWLTFRSDWALRASGLLIGYGFMVAAFARPSNLYWSLLVSPLMLAGAALAIGALRKLAANRSRSI